jgi:hypothetical protein
MRNMFFQSVKYVKLKRDPFLIFDLWEMYLFKMVNIHKSKTLFLFLICVKICYSKFVNLKLDVLFLFIIYEKYVLFKVVNALNQ